LYSEDKTLKFELNLLNPGSNAINESDDSNNSTIEIDVKTLDSLKI
jgi:hypothetical protein